MMAENDLEPFDESLRRILEEGAAKGFLYYCRMIALGGMVGVLAILFWEGGKRFAQ